MRVGARKLMRSDEQVSAEMLLGTASVHAAAAELPGKILVRPLEEYSGRSECRLPDELIIMYAPVAPLFVQPLQRAKGLAIAVNVKRRAVRQSDGPILRREPTVQAPLVQRQAVSLVESLVKSAGRTGISRLQPINEVLVNEFGSRPPSDKAPSKSFGESSEDFAFS